MLLDGVTHLDVIAVGRWRGNHAAPQYGFHGIISNHGTATMIIKQGKQPIHHFTKTDFTSDLEQNVKINLNTIIHCIAHIFRAATYGSFHYQLICKYFG